MIVLGEAGNRYGLAVDRFLGERELVVQNLDSRLGKVANIAAGALMDDGLPVLIVDVEDTLRSIEVFTAGRRNMPECDTSETRRKRVLVVDDSLTVRELQRGLLARAGYEVEVAVNGMDAWNSARTTWFDLILTDIDMPRMGGLELVANIKRDRRLSAVPVIIVSYKDRAEDRRRGFEAGADYYMSKGEYDDASLVRAVIDLIGAAA